MDIDEGVVCEILSRVPTKSALRFRAVCRHWKELIDSEFFIQRHLALQKARLMLQHSGSEYVHFDAGDLPGFDVFRGPDMHEFGLHLAGATQGAICHANGNFMFVWNPTVQRCVTLYSPDLYLLPVEEDMTYTGLGFDASTKTLKVVKFCVLDFQQAAVFSFGTQEWKKVEGLGDADLAPFADATQLLVRQVAYWLAYAPSPDEEKSSPDEENAQGEYSLMTIVAFDYKAERFNAIDFPVKAEPGSLQISQWQDDFLAVLHYKEGDHGRACDVWVMDGDASWAKRLRFSFTEGLRRSAFWVLDEGAKVLATTPFGTLELHLTTTNIQQPLPLNPSWYHYVFADYFDGAHAHHFAHHFVESLILLLQGAPMQN